MTIDVDPITVSVVQHRLKGIVEEMGEAMLRTSFSQILNSSRDFSTAICGADGRMVRAAYRDTSMPVAEYVALEVGPEGVSLAIVRGKRRKTIEMAAKLKKDAWNPVHKALLDYLLRDETKHDTLIEQLNEVKKGMSQASGG